jgi:hypothetical protein
MTETPVPGTEVAPAGQRPARGYSWPPFAPGHTLSLKHGVYSERKIGERAAEVLADLAEVMPDLVNDPDSAALVGLYVRSLAREQLGHLAIERLVADKSPIPPRLLEAVSAAARVAKEVGDSLGVGPRASAELRQIKAATALTMSELARQAPAVLEAVRRTLEALGLGPRSDEFEKQLALELEEVAGDDEDD